MTWTNSSWSIRSSCRLLVFAAIVHFGQVSFAQTPPSPAKDSSTDASQTSDRLDRNVVQRFLDDERAIWTSPFRINHEDVKWLLPLGAGAVFLKTVDSRISREVGESKLQSPSSIVSSAGNVPVLVAPVAILAIGKLSHNEKTRETGELALEAVLHSSIVVQVLKYATNRERPVKDTSRGDFWDGGQSFPSGHAITAFSFATVMAEQYPENKWIKFGSYGFASAVGLSRISGLNHFPSDVLVGASMGYLIGHYVVRHAPKR